MDTANLSFAQVFLTILGSFSAAGLAFAIGFRVFPALGFRGFSGKKQSARISIDNADNLTRVDGRLFPTEILGLEGNIIRYRDGSFAKAYRFEPANTLFDDQRMTE